MIAPQVTDAMELRRFAARTARAVALERGLSFPSCYDDGIQADALRLELRRRLRRYLPGLAPQDRERMILEAT